MKPSPIYLLPLLCALPPHVSQLSRQPSLKLITPHVLLRFRNPTPPGARMPTTAPTP